jgi:hypothetical protein
MQNEKLFGEYTDPSRDILARNVCVRRSNDSGQRCHYPMRHSEGLLDNCGLKEVGNHDVWLWMKGVPYQVR